MINKIWEELAQKHVTRKFCKGVATKIIENYMDVDCPGVLIYKGGQLVDKIIPAAEMFGGLRMNKDCVEFVLSLKNFLPQELEEDPRAKLQFKTRVTRKRQRSGEEDDLSDEELDDRGYANTDYKYRLK